MMIKKTLILLYPNCIEFEIMLASELLNKKFPVEIATPEGSAHIGSNGMVYKTQLKYSDVTVDDYQIVLVPGGDPYEVLENKELFRILSEASEKELIIGAICAGPLLLAKAGILKGKNFTHGYGEQHQEFLQQFWEGANVKNQLMVTDDKLVTAKPQGNIDFAIEIARLSGVIKDNDVETYLKYYKGIV